MRLFIILFLVWVWVCVQGKDSAEFLRDIHCGTSRSDPPESEVHCNILIAGGGWGGLHSAYVLSKYTTGICIVELEDELGGRVYDVEAPESEVEDWRVTGACAIRFQEFQYEMRCLLHELDIEMELSGHEKPFFIKRGRRAEDINEFSATGEHAGLYFGLPAPDPNNCGIDCDLFDYLSGETDINPLTGEYDPALSRCGEYNTVRDYCNDVLSPEACQFLHDSYFFGADFLLPIRNCAYWDYYNTRKDLCCRDFYPRGGHSRAIRTMEERAVDRGVSIFKGEAVECINKSGKKYHLRSSKRFFTADRLIVGLPKDAMEKVGGEIAGEFHSVAPVELFTLTVWWPYDWWSDLKEDPFSDMVIESTDHCFKHAEFFGNPYYKGQFSTRPIYTDDPTCVQIWKNLAETKGVEGVVEELLREFSEVFPDREIPIPRKAEVHHQPIAWYRPHHAGVEYSNDHIQHWAVNPLPNERICMVSESWHPSYTAWARGAVLQSLIGLRAQFSDILPDDFDDLYSCIDDNSPPLSNEYFPNFPSYEPFGLERTIVEDASSSASIYSVENLDFGSGTESGCKALVPQMRVATVLLLVFFIFQIQNM